MKLKFHEDTSKGKHNVAGWYFPVLFLSALESKLAFVVPRLMQYKHTN